MILSNMLYWGTSAFQLQKIDDPSTEARVLLGHILNLSSTELYAQSERILSPDQIVKFQKFVERRLSREPTAYIINRKEFYGIDFYVDNSVLIPRPETELLVDEAISFIRSKLNNSAYLKKPMFVADIGTGCGSIAISLAKNISDIKIYATDISSSALRIARLNSKRADVAKQIIFLQGNLLEAIPEYFDLLIANLPYIKNSELANLCPEIFCFEPEMAIAGGSDGLELIYRLIKQIKGRSKQPTRILLEIGQGQDKQLISFLKQTLPQAIVELVKDLNDINRVAIIDL